MKDFAGHPFTIMTVLFVCLIVSWFLFITKAVNNRPQTIPLTTEVVSQAATEVDQTP